MAKSKILIVNGCEVLLQTLHSRLHQDFAITTTRSTIDAYNLLAAQPFDVVLAQQNMPSMSGTEFLQTIATNFPSVQRILITEGANTFDLINAINKAKVFSVLLLPIDMQAVKATIFDALKELKRNVENEKLIQDLTSQNQQFEFILRQRLLS